MTQATGSREVAESFPKKRGRPLSFDRAAALEQAMLAFWRHGYETTSIADLTASMGITAPSLYAAFGDKKQLFLEALRLYAGDPASVRLAVERAPSAAMAARDLLRSAAITYTGSATPAGCLLASATASGSAASADVQKVVATVRRNIAACLEARIRSDVAAKLLPPNTDAAGLSGLVVAVAQGMSVLARDGAKRSALLSIVERSFDAWPTPLSARRRTAGPATG